jgi:ATP-dependent Lon protease
LIPADNEKDLAEIPKNIKDKLNIVPVKWIDEVFALALQHIPRPKPKGETAAGERDTTAQQTEESKVVLPH